MRNPESIEATRAFAQGFLRVYVGTLVAHTAIEVEATRATGGGVELLTIVDQGADGHGVLVDATSRGAVPLL